MVTDPGLPANVADQPRQRARGMAAYGIVGLAFGFVLTRGETVSWFRIQEMFRFQSPRMYLIIGSALAVATLSLALLRRAGVRALNGEAIAVAPKTMGRGHRYWIGGGLFGIGWALTGVCPGPIFALIGNGTTVMIAVAVAALAGTWTYGWLRPRLPH